MNVTVIGTGYVGLVVGACLAETGNDVACVDIDQDKIDRLKRNDIPIFEPGLEPLVSENQAAGRLVFSTEIGTEIERADVVFIAVGTPPDEDGSADLQHVLDVAQTVGRHMNRPKVVITKSTVPVGTAAKVQKTVSDHTDQEFHVCSNPEFLKEGAAVNDFMKPDRVVVGVDSEHARKVLAELYAPFVRTGNPLIFMDIASAELTKYAANAMLATRISFMNQIAELCEKVGADVSLVRRGMGSDKRIGPAFLFPGPGYGGSCFPKDVKALVNTALREGVSLDVLDAVERVNARQKTVLFSKLQELIGDELTNQKVAVWGLAFKAETDDMRESPAIPLVNSLVGADADVRVHDPQALEGARARWKDAVNYYADPYECLTGADALVIVTEWRAFRTPAFERMQSLMAQPNIIDGRNLYEPQRMVERGFRYSCIGRGV